MATQWYYIMVAILCDSGMLCALIPHSFLKPVAPVDTQTHVQKSRTYGDFEKLCAVVNMICTDTSVCFVYL